MKNYSWLIVIVCAILWGGTSVKADLKLGVSSTGSPSDGSQTVVAQRTVYVAGAKWRDDSKYVISIVDMNVNKVTLIFPLDRTYGSGRYSDLLGPAIKANARHKVAMTETGETMRILGHVCHHYIVKSQEKPGIAGIVRYDILATDDFKMPGSSFGSEFGLGERETAVIYGFPLKVTRTESTGQKLTFEVVSISTERLPPDTFHVPGGYKLKH